MSGRCRKTSLKVGDVTIPFSEAFVVDTTCGQIVPTDALMDAVAETKADEDWRDWLMEPENAGARELLTVSLKNAIEAAKAANLDDELIEEIESTKAYIEDHAYVYAPQHAANLLDDYLGALGAKKKGCGTVTGLQTISSPAELFEAEGLFLIRFLGENGSDPDFVNVVVTDQRTGAAEDITSVAARLGLRTADGEVDGIFMSRCGLIARVTTRAEFIFNPVASPS